MFGRVQPTFSRITPELVEPNYMMNVGTETLQCYPFQSLGRTQQSGFSSHFSNSNLSHTLNK